MRTQVPDDVSAEVMYQHDRICCVCNEPGKAVQIHHIDEDPSNHDQDNLAVLCLQHHEDTHVKGGFSRKLRATDVRKHRDEWIRRVRDRRSQVDKLSVERAAPQPVAQADLQHEKFYYRPSSRVLDIYLNQFPKTLRDIYSLADDACRQGDNKDSVLALRLVVSSLEQVLVQLSKWIDPQHFQGQPPRDFYSQFLAERNRWNRMLIEPKDYGEQSRTGTIDTLAETAKDMRQAINSLVLALTKAYLPEFNFVWWCNSLPKHL